MKLSAIPRASIPSIYLNIVLLNKDEVVKDTVAKKTGLKGGIFGRVLSHAANRVISDQSVINTMSQRLKESIESTVSKMGISAVLTKSFQQGAYVVMKLQIENVEIVHLIHAAKGAEFATHFATLVESITCLGQAETALPNIINKILVTVHDAMLVKLSTVIPQKLEEMGMHVDFIVSSREDQAENMFSIIDNISGENNQSSRTRSRSLDKEKK